MKLLITGGAGQLATDVARVAGAAGDEVVTVTRADLDITDRSAVHAVLGEVRPDAVVNTAAWTAVDACEGDLERAFAANAIGPRWLAEATTRVGAHLVHVSTDYVFDGTKDGAYHEWDEPSPASAYGRSKLAGEQECWRHAGSVAVARTAWVMGAHGANMLKTIVSLRDRDELAFVDDQVGSPTFTADLAVALRRLAVERIGGLYHLTNSGQTSWFGLVQDVLRELGEDPDKVRPIRTDELDPPRPAPRPANSVLDDVAWRGAGGEPLPLYRDSLRAALVELGVHPSIQEHE